MDKPVRGAYYLCLAPDISDQEFNVLFRLISEIADILDSNSSFLPHITLIGDIKDYELAVQVAQQVAQNLSPFTVELGAVTSWKMPWQALLFPVEKTAPLIGARLAAEKALHVQGSWTPHLSIAYGDLNSEQLTQLTELAQSRVAQPFTFQAKTIELWYAGADLPIEDWETEEVFRFSR